MASTATAPQVARCEMDVGRISRKCCGRPCMEEVTATGLTCHEELKAQFLRNTSDAVLEMDAVLEQIERNRKIVEQLSPVLKYKELMRKRRCRAAPRRKFSIVQGYPRISRWKGTKTELQASNSGQKYYLSLKWPTLACCELLSLTKSCYQAERTFGCNHTTVPRKRALIKLKLQLSFKNFIDFAMPVNRMDTKKASHMERKHTFLCIRLHDYKELMRFSNAPPQCSRKNQKIRDSNCECSEL